MIARRAAPMMVVGLWLIGGCAPAAVPLLGRADDEMAATRYAEAARLYEEFLKNNPDHPAAIRARAAQNALDKLLATQKDLERLRAQLEQTRAELAQARQELATRATEGSSKNADVTRLRRDLDARQSEVERLKADLERLRSIDLRREPARR